MIELKTEKKPTAEPSYIYASNENEGRMHLRVEYKCPSCDRMLAVREKAVRLDTSGNVSIDTEWWDKTINTGILSGVGKCSRCDQHIDWSDIVKVHNTKEES